MLPLDQNELTAEEVRQILFAPVRTEIFRYKLLDKDENEKGFLDTIKDCRITYNSLSTLKVSAAINMKDTKTVDFLNDRVQPFCTIRALGKEVTWPMGIFLLKSPGRETDGVEIIRNIEAYSKLHILEEDKFTDRYYIPEGSNYINEIAKIIQSTGETKINLTPTTRVTQAPKEYEIGQSKLEVINELLDELNYFSLRVDNYGYFIAEPYVLPIDRDVDFNYIDDQFSVICPDMKEDIDLFSVPNVFVCYTTSPERESLRSIYENTNPSSPTSIENRGRRIVQVYTKEDVADQESLDDYTRRLAFQYSQVYSHIDFYTALMPFHDFFDTLYLRNRRFEIEGKYEEMSWEIECKAGARMKHRARKVVNI